jgi:RNA polymerase sigma-54 factor
MLMRLAQTLRQTPTVSPQLVLANALLQCSSLELEQAIAQELAENPALELCEVEQCPHCAAGMRDGFCPSCGALEAEVEEPWAARPDGVVVRDYGLLETWGPPPGGRESDDERDYGRWDPAGAAEGWEDPAAWLASKTTLDDHLLHQVRLNLPAAELPIALYLIENLDDRGLLCCDLEDVASALSVPREQADKVLVTVQSLDPVGIAARDVQECLLIQLAHLRREGIEQALAERLIREHWAMLSRCSLSRVAREAGVRVEAVHRALRFIRENLNPFPAHVFWTSRRQAQLRWAPVSSGEVWYVQPDVIIRESRSPDREFEVELPKARRSRLRVSGSYRQTTAESGSGGSTADREDWEDWEEWERCRARARWFVRSIEQRWQTLYELACRLIDYQHDFLVHGEKHLRPLTRARVAEMMDVHEATVCRAVAGKYVLLPRGRVVPLAKFFDSAAPIKQMIEELVQGETRPLSDQEIAERLRAQGWDIARRTVAKYRNALEILPSPLRRRSREL